MADNYREYRGDYDDYKDTPRKRKGSTNWWPLLFLPVAFVIGWVGGDASDNTTNNQAYTNQTQPGIGGGPDVTITTVPSQTVTVTPIPTQEVSLTPFPSVGQ